MADPFQTTYEGARQGLGTLGQALQQIAGQYAERKAEERELEVEERRRKEERELEEDKLKQDAITNAYKFAQDAATSYLENPDPNDENPSVTSRALAAETFDNYMRTSGFADTTFLDLAGSETAKIEEKEEKEAASPLSAFLGKPTLPATAPMGERIGERVGQIGRKGLGMAGELPSRAAGGLAQIYNLISGATRGATGIPTRGIPKQQVDVMTRGKLFDVPTAVDFYMKLFGRKKR